MSLMKFISLFTFIAVYFLSVTACANQPSTEKVENFTLPDYKGNEHKEQICALNEKIAKKLISIFYPHSKNVRVWT